MAASGPSVARVDLIVGEDPWSDLWCYSNPVFVDVAWPALDRIRSVPPDHTTHASGRGGREYERTVLIGLLSGIDHERHVCRVMAEVEPHAGLEKFLIGTGRRYDDLHDRIEALSEAEDFRDPDGTTANRCGSARRVVYSISVGRYP